ncbi:MAG: diaminopropionate ammonia-lyase [Acidimicrobiales bacterium]
MSQLEIFRNPRREAGREIVCTAGVEALEFHRRLAGYEPSPLVEAPRLAAGLGLGRVLVKDESSRLGLPSFKMLGASWATYRALRERVTGAIDLETWDEIGELAARLEADRGPAQEQLTLVAATDGNHGRAVARMASLLGLAAKIYVPSGTASGRIEAIESEGASCAVVEGSYDDAVARSALDAGPRHLVISDTSWPGYTTVPSWVIEGYSTIFHEIEEQLSTSDGARQIGSRGIDAVVVPIGVGALACAAVRAYRANGAAGTPVMIGVEPLGADCMLQSVRAGTLVTTPGPHRSIMAGLNCGRASEIAFPVVAGGMDVFVAIEDDPVRDAMRRLADEGIVSGETGAAGLAGLGQLLGSDNSDAIRDELRLGPGATVLLVSTEGATDLAGYRAIVGRDPEDVAAATTGCAHDRTR